MDKGACPYWVRYLTIDDYEPPLVLQQMNIFIINNLM